MRSAKAWYVERGHMVYEVPTLRMQSVRTLEAKCRHFAGQVWALEWSLPNGVEGCSVCTAPFTADLGLPLARVCRPWDVRMTSNGG